jgi:D-serine deaminase-like pyridoxal phosphate-dependent protein
MRSIAASLAARAVGQALSDVDTPALVVDLNAVEANLTRMQQFANQHNVLLRPHAKMHKCAELSKLQIGAGAVGVCVQKTSEAEALAAEGISNIFISNEVTSRGKLARVAKLASELYSRTGTPSLALCCDSLIGVERLVAAMKAETKDATPLIRVLVEVDVGQGRCGVKSASDAVAVATEIVRNNDVLTFGGIHAYHGGAQHIRDVDVKRATITAVIDQVVEVKKAFALAGIAVPLVTGAGTGTFPFEAASGVYGELQAGSYLFMDRDYADNALLPSNVPAFEHALFVLTEVISTSPDGRTAICDAGHKSHAIDSGLPRVFGRTDIAFSNAGDEHGKLSLTADAPNGSGLSVGDRFLLIPGHCDPTVNLHDVMLGYRNEVVERVLTVTSRGCVS